jgi:hypothetical protein
MLADDCTVHVTSIAKIPSRSLIEVVRTDAVSLFFKAKDLRTERVADAVLAFVWCLLDRTSPGCSASTVGFQMFSG